LLIDELFVLFGTPARSSDEAHAWRLSGVASRSNGLGGEVMIRQHR